MGLQWGFGKEKWGENDTDFDLDWSRKFRLRVDEGATTGVEIQGIRCMKTTPYYYKKQWFFIKSVALYFYYAYNEDKLKQINVLIVFKRMTSRETDTATDLSVGYKHILNIRYS